MVTTMKQMKNSKPQREQRAREILSPYFMIKIVKLNMSLIRDLKLEPMDYNEGPKILHKITQPTDYADLIFTVQITNKYTKERTVSIAFIGKMSKESQVTGSVDIPWVHWPRFTWHFKKIAKEVEQIMIAHRKKHEDESKPEPVISQEVKNNIP